MYGINEATIIASLAIPDGLFIGFSTILVNRHSPMYVMTTSMPAQPKKQSWFGLGEFIGGILFDLYARY